MLFLLYFALFVSSPLSSALVTALVTVPSERHTSHESAVKRQVGESLDGNTRIHIEISLTQSNIDHAASQLLAISDPSSPDYGRLWTAKEVAQKFAPSSQHVSAVTQWLRNHSIPMSHVHMTEGRGHLIVHSDLTTFQRLFTTTCRAIRKGEQEEVAIDCTEYQIPEALASAIEYVAATMQKQPSQGPLDPYRLSKSKRAVLGSPVTRLSDVQGFRIASTTPEFSCNEYTSPYCLRELYNIPQASEAHPNNSFGIYQQAYMTWLAEDLDLFFGRFEPDLVGRRPVVEPIAGGYMQTEIKISPFNLEPNLDFQYAISLTGPQEVTNLQIGDMYLGGNVNNMLAAFDQYYCDALDPAVDPIYPNPLEGGYNKTDCGTVVPPKVISISFAWPEASFSPEYLKRQCLEFLKLGLMGVTTIVSSGDSGTQAGVDGGTCIHPETGVPEGKTGRFNPQWPASCPWVTSVGGTKRVVAPGNNSTAAGSKKSRKDRRDVREEAWHYSIEAGNETYIYTSSGGFSNHFPMPDYQKAAISRYHHREDDHLDGLESEGHFSRGGRGFPDVSALASSYLIYMYNQLVSVHGTSASAPVFASMITMINNERLKAGKGTVGFVNPALYAHAGRAFNDVTDGANVGCGAETAFRAARGWDAVTGLGSPDYEKLRKVLTSLP
nr:peptidase [Acaulium album]